MIDRPLFEDESRREHDACGVGFLADSRGRASHRLLAQALEAVSCLEHRGGCGADRDSGDGAGLLCAIPWTILADWCADNGLALPAEGERAVGMLFLPRAEADQRRCRELVVQKLVAQGIEVVGWRPVPVEPGCLGEQAARTRPEIVQVILRATAAITSAEQLERRLYLARKAIRSTVDSNFSWEVARHFHFASLSGRTIVYKGMVRSQVLPRFYPDLADERFVSAFAIYHRRFSTNTFPRWPLAQPLRLLGHNGEINTVLGNRNWMAAREPGLVSKRWAERIEGLKPILEMEGSDSASLDNAFELLVRSGRNPLHSMMMLVPEAFRNQPALAGAAEVAGFYEYHAPLQEAWDGPALVVFSDGIQVGASLDRNGLRPARYTITDDGLVIVSSEAGVVDVPLERVVEKGRLGPGQMIAVDLEAGTILKNWDIKQQVSRQQPYGQWVADFQQHLEAQPYPDTQIEAQQLLVRQRASGYTLEDVERIIVPMAQAGKEPVMSMGDDTPLAVLSQKERLLYDYFKQRFAQVTNPPIDPIREGLVMSLEMYLGPRGSWLEEKPEFARLVRLASPILNEAQLDALRNLAGPFRSSTLQLTFDIAAGVDGLQARVEVLCAEAEAAVRAGAGLLILSDRGVDSERAIVPPLLAVGAIHHHLIAAGLRLGASIVVETAQCWSTHHFACLIGYGASAICPYLAYETIRHWWAAPTTRELVRNGKSPT